MKRNKLIKLTAPILGTLLGKIYVLLIQFFLDRIIYLTDEMELLIIAFTIFAIIDISGRDRTE